MKKGAKIAAIISCSFVGVLAVGVVSVGLIMDNTGITYTLDSDVKIKQITPHTEVVHDSNLPGTTIKHTASSTRKDYKIQVFTDSHLDHNQKTCNYTFSMIARNIMLEEPDLVVFCGDNITSSFNKPRTIQFGQLLEDLGVYWTAVLGNHEKSPDNPFCISRNRMLKIWSGYKHCLIDTSTKFTSSGEMVWGDGNHVINLLGDDNSVIQSLYMFDNGHYMSNKQMEQYKEAIQSYKDMGKAKQTETEFYDHIKDSQVTWYKETASKIESTHTTIFAHHPLKEMEIGYIDRFKEYNGITQGVGANNNIYAYTDIDQNKAKDVSDLYTDESGFVKGERCHRREDICYSPHDNAYENGETPIFKAMKEIGNNNAFFCGHDHSNNFTIRHQNQFIGYIQPACYSSNNLYTKGLMGDDPYNSEEKGLLEGHLIQGYTLLTYSSSSNGVNNVLSKIEYKENYSNYPQLYSKAIDLIKAQKGDYTEIKNKRINKEGGAGLYAEERIDSI